MKLLLTVIFVTFLLYLPLGGQTVVPEWDEYIAEQIESGAIGEDEGAEFLERWMVQKQHPLDINTLTREDLEQFPFLNEFQIRHFLLYRHAHPEGFDSIWVLREIAGWDRRTCLLLWPMLTVQKRSESAAGSFREILSYAHHDVSVHTDAILQRQEGYRPDSRHPYRGDPWGGGLRWSYAMGNRFSIGLTASKDRGEPAFDKRRKGFDSYSAHFFMEGKGAVRAVALGDYRIGMGYGLLVNQASFMGMAYAYPRGGTTLRRAFTYAEDNFMRGAATALAQGRWALTAFYSRKGVDATVTEDGAIKAIYHTGLHRTDAEIARRNAATMTTAGTSVSYTDDRLRLTFNLLHLHWGGLRLLRAVGTKGIASLTDLERFSLVSADYSYLFGQGGTELFGEFAGAANGAVGTINGLRYTHPIGGSYMLVGRYIPADYWSYYRGAFVRHSRPGNEWGVMGRAAWELPSDWTVRAFADYYGSFVPRFGRKEKTEAFHWILEGEKSLSALSWSCRIRGTADKRYRRSLAVRLRGRYAFDERWRLMASLQWSRSNSFDGQQQVWQAPTGGKSLALRADYSGGKLLRVCSMDAVAFDTDSFADRLYEAVHNPRHHYSSAFFYGRGVRLGLFVRIAPLPHVEVESRIDHLLRRDTDTIGSAGELIRGQARTHLLMTVRYR